MAFGCSFLAARPYSYGLRINNLDRPQVNLRVHLGCLLSFPPSKGESRSQDSPSDRERLPARKRQRPGQGTQSPARPHRPSTTKVKRHVTAFVPALESAPPVTPQTRFDCLAESSLAFRRVLLAALLWASSILNTRGTPRAPVYQTGRMTPYPISGNCRMTSHVGTLERRPFSFGHALLSKEPDVCVCPAVPGGHSFHEPKHMISPYEKRSLGYPLATPGPLPVRHRLLSNLQDKGLESSLTVRPFHR